MPDKDTMPAAIPAPGKADDLVEKTLAPRHSVRDEGAPGKPLRGPGEKVRVTRQFAERYPDRFVGHGAE